MMHNLMIFICFFYRVFGGGNIMGAQGAQRPLLALGALIVILAPIVTAGKFYYSSYHYCYI